MPALSDLSSRCSAYNPARSSLDNRFRFWQVEALLNQTADLLDRCVSERQLLQSLDVRRQELEFNIQENDIYLTLQQMQSTDNWYALDNDIQTKTSAAAHLVAAALLGARTAAQNYLAQAQTDSMRVITASNADAAVEGENVQYLIREARAQAANKGKIRQDYLLAELTKINNSRRDATKSDGAFSFTDQINSLMSRITADYSDAYDRALVARDGLQKIFGYMEAFPGGTGAPRSLDALMLWVRRAISWMAAFAQYDQTFSTTLSVRRQISNGVGNNWNRLLDDLKAGRPANIAFDLDATTIATHYFVRVRGIRAFTRGAVDLLSARIAVPVDAVSTRPDTAPVPIDQKSIPACLLGRIEKRDAQREPEIVGSLGLMNASPFSDQNAPAKSRAWNIEIFPPYREPLAATASLEDIEIEMLLVGRPAEATI